MGFDITDLGNTERIVFVNFWNWHPTVELIRTAKLLDAGRLDGLHQQCCATCVSREEARAIARHLRETVLPSVPSDARVLLDGTVTSAPDDGTFYRDPSDADRNYSATRS